LPAKGLQATVKAFIKTEAKKRATEAAAPVKQSVDTAEEPVKSIESAAETLDTTATLPSKQPDSSKAAGNDSEKIEEGVPLAEPLAADSGSVG
jgi:hypothetical protein